MEKMRINWYPGTSKSAAEEGHEKLDSNADNKIFGYACRNPRAQGWQDAPPEQHLGLYVD